MNFRLVLPAFGLILAITALSFSGCDTLVTERIENTVVDSDLEIRCLECHKNDNNLFLRPHSQWAISRHSSGEHIDAASACGPQCHSHEGYISFFDSVNVTNSGYSVIGCFTCHSPHGYAYDDWNDSLVRILRGVDSTGTAILSDGSAYSLDLTDKSIMCVNCHMSPNDNTDPAGAATTDIFLTSEFGPHFSAQADVIVSKGGYLFGEAAVTASHKDALSGRDGCLSCHYGSGDEYNLGGHTFRLENIADGSQLISNCNVSACHTSNAQTEMIVHFDSSTAIMTLAASVDSLHNMLKSMNVFNASDNFRTDSAFHPDLARMLHNYLLYQQDGSGGNHNAAYLTQAIDISLQWFDSLAVQVAYSYDTTAICSAGTVTFSASWLGPVDSLQWDFGDTIVIVTPPDTIIAHQYDSVDVFDVSLVAFGPNPNNADTTTLPLLITVFAGLPVADFNAVPATGNVPLTVDFSDLSTAAVQWSWDFGEAGDADTSSLVEPTWIFTTDGTFTVTLTVTNPCGTHQIQKDVVVIP